MMNDNDILLRDIPQDSRYKDLTVHDLKVMRANMITMGGYTKYAFASVQYWIMHKEGRLP